MEQDSIEHFAQMPQHRLRRTRQRRRGQPGVAQRQNPRPQLEILTVFCIDEPQLAQGIQAAAHRGARNAGLLTDL